MRSILISVTEYHEIIQRGGETIKRSTLVLCALLILSLAIPSIAFWEIGRGYSTDTIYGCELSGFPWKTWSCWLTNDHPSVGKDATYTAVYSVDKSDTELVELLDTLGKENKKRLVKVYYRNEWLVFPWDYSSSTIIYKVEILE